MPKSARLARETFLGLCTTCANVPGCTLAGNRRVPVMQCLEFAGENATIAAVRPTRPTAARAEETSPFAREPGLCSWCEIRETCTFPKSPGGVWSCEEFR